MIDPKFAAPASRLCLACGMCCNGVLFQIVRVQQTDSIADLERHGLKLRRKKRDPYFDQPCAMLDGCRCTIYAQRPLRCRSFECQQILRLSRGETTESAALKKIEEARKLVGAVQAKLTEVGDTATDEPLLQRCAQSLPQNDEAVQRLDLMLNAEFFLQ
jgi:Fe-S-cluster containining protein